LFGAFTNAAILQRL
jgi:hypothetical protein